MEREIKDKDIKRYGSIEDLTQNELVEEDDSVASE